MSGCFIVLQVLLASPIPWSRMEGCREAGKEDVIQKLCSVSHVPLARTLSCGCRVGWEVIFNFGDHVLS